jgi:hypothetical protein
VDGGSSTFASSGTFFMIFFLPVNQRYSTYSVQKFGGTTKTGRHRSGRLLKNSVKLGKNQKIRSKRTGDDRGIVKLGTPINRLVWSINRSFSQKTGVVISRQFVTETDHFLLKIGKWNEKTVKNNDTTSTKFVHTNSL